jgi:hypothetical protein
MKKIMNIKTHIRINIEKTKIYKKYLYINPSKNISNNYVNRILVVI